MKGSGSMKELFQLISEMNMNRDCLLVTLLEGENAGEKAMFYGGELSWAPEELPYFREHGPEILAQSETGIHTAAGQKYYAERVSKEKKIVICGAGHVGAAVVRAAKFVGLRTIAIDDRPMFADEAKKAGADEAVCDSFEDALAGIPGDSDTYFVIVTRGHRWDQECLRMIAKKPHAYIGLMGSRRRVKFVKETLESEGISKEVLDRVYTPIGLNIGGETPEEIAVSIIAEIIGVKNKEKNSGFSGEILDAVTGEHHREEEAAKKKMLATIISRRGSAPRDVGTKMLVLEDGSCIGTIGGGCVEADVTRKCRELLLEDRDVTLVYHVDLTAEEAEKEGMVCGGVLEVLLERI